MLANRQLFINMDSFHFHITNLITRQAGYRISLRYVDKMHKDLRDSLVISTLGDLQKLEDFLFVAIGKDDRNKSLCRKILARLQS